VLDTGAEVMVAGDSSCLMHVGGILSRQRAGVRVMHLAEVLAATESTQESQLPAGRDTTGAAAAGASPESTDRSRLPAPGQEQS
jgi:L-lactate dehydrogenase complex protein LldE